MNLISGERRSGKTTRILKLASKNQSTIVTWNSRHASQLFETAKSMGLAIPKPITFEKFLNRANHQGVKSFCFEELGQLLCSMTRCPIIASTWDTTTHPIIKLQPNSISFIENL